ncbi:MAG TPA: electron transfer flavoprotein subunit alpha/FixB family protein, partial [Candidatus Dormibacteraeota bacterium]|nr:electron transfer flavoprotein subunit alpha/FixB family protein [Candidatus Dormibacteraeota bacterium]
PDRWRAVPPEQVRRLGPEQLAGAGPWGQAGSPTRVESVREIAVVRRPVRLEGPLPEQVERAVALLGAAGALAGRRPRPSRAVPLPRPGADRRRSVAVLLEPGRPRLAAELLGRAAVLARGLRGSVVAVTPATAGAQELWALGADELVWVVGTEVAEDVAAALGDWVRRRAPWAVLGPGTSWGREVLARAAARLGAGLIGDAVDVQLEDGRLVGWKPALGGGLLARVTASSAVQMATVRPGALPVLRHRLGAGSPAVTRLAVRARGRVEIGARWQDDHPEALALARSVVGVGIGVPPEGYPAVRRLAHRLGAELAATRKVTDQGWLPRFRQVGITGRFIAPRLYVAVGVQGKLNHMLGVRQAQTILAINRDPDAPVFGGCDIGIVGDWHQTVALLTEALPGRGRT